MNFSFFGSFFERKKYKKEEKKPKIKMNKEEKIVMGGSNFFQKSLVITNYEFFCAFIF